jgi:hypothetical protein
MVKITIYVEGGGDSNRLKTKCHQGFSEFFKKLGIVSTLEIKIHIVACGSRNETFKDFCRTLKSKNSDINLLLIDSEKPIKINSNVWQHLCEIEKWQKPEKATEEQLHFMVECMEAWFMSDVDALAGYYGKDFNKNVLSKNTNIENISKQDLFETLNNATRKTTKGGYSKGSHSFEILSKIDANKIVTQSPYASRLYKTLQELQNPK